MPNDRDQIARRWFSILCCVALVLVLLAFVNEALSVGGAWRWGKYDDEQNVFTAIQTTLSKSDIDYHGRGLADSMQRLGAYGVVLLFGTIALRAGLVSREEASRWKGILVSAVLLLTAVHAADSVSQLPVTLFEWKHGSRYGVYDRYSDLTAFSEAGKVGFKRADGQVAIPARFSCVESPKSFGTPPAIVVGIDEKRTLIDFKGEQLFPAIYDELSSLMLDRDWIRAKYEGKWGFIDYRGRVKLPFNYEELGEMDSSGGKVRLASFRSSGKWGYVSESGKVVLPAVWDKAFGFFDGAAQVWRVGKACYIDQTGKELVPCEYDYVQAMKSGPRDLFWVTQKDRTGLYDSLLSKIAIPIKYGSKLSSSEVKRLPEGYMLTPSKDDPALREAEVVFFAFGQEPVISWADPVPREDDRNRPRGFSQSPGTGGVALYCGAGR